MNYKEFFERHGERSVCTRKDIGGISSMFSIEYLYQMFKARMLEEMKQEAKKPTCDYQAVDNANGATTES